MLKILRREHQLLKDHYAAVWYQQKLHYIGEVAGKLRLLVADTSSAGPLLLKLFEITNINPILKFNGPAFPVKPGELDPNRPRTLDEYLNGIAFGTAVATGKYVELSNRELILVWAQEDGASHVSWQMNPLLRDLFEMGNLPLINLPGSNQALRAIASTVLTAGDDFLSHVAHKDLS
jgi:hypothetical protein